MDMNEIELQRLYGAELTARTRDHRLQEHDRNAAAATLEASERLLGKGLKRADEHRTWVFSDPHFGDTVCLHVFDRPFRTTDEGDRFVLEDWRARGHQPGRGRLPRRRSDEAADGRADRPDTPGPRLQGPRGGEP